MELQQRVPCLPPIARGNRSASCQYMHCTRVPPARQLRTHCIKTPALSTVPATDASTTPFTIRSRPRVACLPTIAVAVASVASESSDFRSHFTHACWQFVDGRQPVVLRDVDCVPHRCEQFVLCTVSASGLRQEERPADVLVPVCRSQLSTPRGIRRPSPHHRLRDPSRCRATDAVRFVWAEDWDGLREGRVGLPGRE